MYFIKTIKTVFFFVIILAGFLLAGFFLSDSSISRGPAGAQFNPAAVALREVENSHLKALADERLLFVDSTQREWVAPGGTLTDGASVPRLGLLITNGRFESSMLKASIVHDAYCGEDNRGRPQYHSRKWKEVHRMFHEALLAGGTPPLQAKVMFAAVWLGGPRWDDPDRDLSAVPRDVLAAEFEFCRKWILEDDPSLPDLEAWMDKREPNLFPSQRAAR